MQRLHEYLHGLFLHDMHLGALYHTRQLALYARRAPEQLLPFLRASPHYNLDAALEVCRRHRLVDGEVFVLARLGNHRDALALILEPQGEHLLFDNIVMLRPKEPEAPLRANDALMAFTERTWAKRHAAESKMAQCVPRPMPRQPCTRA